MTEAEDEPKEKKNRTEGDKRGGGGGVAFGTRGVWCCAYVLGYDPLRWPFGPISTSTRLTPSHPLLTVLFSDFDRFILSQSEDNRHSLTNQQQ